MAKKAAEEAQKRAGFPAVSQAAVVALPGQTSYTLDKNGKPALAPGQHVDKAGMPIEGPPTHRASCHRYVGKKCSFFFFQGEYLLCSLYTRIVIYRNTFFL